MTKTIHDDLELVRAIVRAREQLASEGGDNATRLLTRPRPTEEIGCRETTVPEEVTR